MEMEVRAGQDAPLQSEHQRALKPLHCCMEALFTPHHFWTLSIAISCVIKSPEKTGEKNNLGKEKYQ